MHSSDTSDDAACRKRRERLLVLPPLAAERRLPVDIGLDAVAVADVHGGLALEAVDRAVQRLDAPGRDLLHVDVERRLIELDHVDAVGLERARLLIEQVGEGERHLHPVAVVLVGDRVDDGHRPGHGDLELARGMRAGEPRLGAVHAAAELERPGHRRHHRLVAVVADAHLDLVGEVDAVDEFEKAVHEMLPRLLAVGDDVDAGVLLQLQRQQRRVELAGGELGAG